MYDILREETPSNVVQTSTELPDLQALIDDLDFVGTSAQEETSSKVLQERSNLLQTPTEWLIDDLDFATTSSVGKPFQKVSDLFPPPPHPYLTFTDIYDVDNTPLFKILQANDESYN